MPVVTLADWAAEGDSSEFVILCEEDEMLVSVWAVELEIGDIVITLRVVVGGEVFAILFEDGLEGLDGALDVVVSSSGVGRCDGDGDLFVVVCVDYGCGILFAVEIFILNLVGAKGVEGSRDLELEFIIIETDVLSGDLLTVGGLNGEVGVIIHIADNHDDNDDYERDSCKGTDDASDNAAGLASGLDWLCRGGLSRLSSFSSFSLWGWFGRWLLGRHGLSLAGRGRDRLRSFGGYFRSL